MIPNFLEYEFDTDSKKDFSRNTMKETKSGKSNQLLNSVEIAQLTKKMEEQMNNEYQEALKKNVSIRYKLEISVYGGYSKMGMDFIPCCCFR